MSQRQPLTTERHQKLAPELFAMTERITSFTVEFSAAFGPQSHQVKSSTRALDAIKIMRAVLENAYLTECERTGCEFSPAVYYPGSRPRKAI